MHHCLRWLALLTTLLSLTAGFAQPKKELERAKKLSQAADTLYDNAQYEDALPIYQKAYALSAKPTLLFNIGQCYRLLGDASKAIDSYEQFLREAPQKEELKNDALTQKAMLQAKQFITELTPKEPEPPQTEPPSTLPSATPPLTKTKKQPQKIYIALAAGSALGALMLAHNFILVPDVVSPGRETPREKRVTQLLGVSADVAFITAGVLYLTRNKETKGGVSLLLGVNHLSARLSF